MITQPRIMIVDDDSMNVAILEEILEEGFVLASAGSGEEALELAREFKPDLFLLDIMMPGIDGYETCRRLRQNPELKLVKVILVSAKAMLSERLKGYDAGADDYVTKPFDHTELLAKIRVFLRLKNAEEVGQLKTDFLTLLSHETRTPLTHILGSAEILISDGNMDPVERKSLGQMVLNAAGRMRDLFEEATLFFSFRSGSISLENRPFDVCAVAREVIDSRKELARSQNVRVFLDAPEKFTLTGDAPSVRTLLRVLLEHVLDAEDENRSVTVSLTGDEKEVSLIAPFCGQRSDEAADTSPFEFFHVQDIWHHRDQLSLGLPLVREIAHHLGGSVEVRPGEAEGSLLRVRIPQMGRPQGAGDGPVPASPGLKLL